MQKVLIVNSEKGLKSELAKYIKNAEIIEDSDTSQLPLKHFDVCMVNVNPVDGDGLALAQRLQEKNPYQQMIMYGKDCDDAIALKTYADLNIIYFFQDDFTKLIEKLKHALSLAKKLNNRHLRINKRSLARIYHVDDIRFIIKVKAQKKLHIRFMNNENKLEIEDINGVSIREIPKMLDLESDLLQIGRGCIINPNKIEHIDFSTNLIKLRNVDTPLPVEPKFKKQLYKLGK